MHLILLIFQGAAFALESEGEVIFRDPFTAPQSGPYWELQFIC